MPVYDFVTVVEAANARAALEAVAEYYARLRQDYPRVDTEGRVWFASARRVLRTTIERGEILPALDEG